MGAALGGTGIEALFFARFGVEYLPYMFLGLEASMIVSFGTTAALRASARSLSRHSIIDCGRVTGAPGLLTKWNWLYPALWLGKEIINSLKGIMIWGIASVVCDLRARQSVSSRFPTPAASSGR